jgi:hypothetical protein
VPWPYTQGEIVESLVGKFGFEQDDRDHDFYVLTLDGRACAYTYVSRGGRDRVTPNIAFRMAREMRLANLAQFRDAVDCPLSSEDYYAILREERVASESDATAEPPTPQQPIRWVWTATGKSFGYIQDAALYTYDGRNVGRLVGGSEEIFALDGRYLGEVYNYNALVTMSDRIGWVEAPADPEPVLRAQHPWPDRDALPMPEGAIDFPHPNAL